MQELVKKYFWLLGIVVVMLCSMFAAMAVNHYVEGEYLGERAEPIKAKQFSARSKPRPAKSSSKKGRPLASRNMFCSECAPIDPEPENPTEVAGDSVPLTSLPLTLIATSLATAKHDSFATIRNISTERQGGYWLGDEIPEAGPVEKIRSKYIDFRNSNTNRLERLALLAKTAKPETPAKTVGRSSKKGRRNELLAAMDAGIKKIDDTHFEIDRGLVEKLLAKPMQAARGARVVPSIKNGKANGFKLYAIRPNSIYSKLGMMNGDTIHAVNGFELTTPDKALEVYTKVRESSNLSVTVTRRGKSKTINYNIQ